MNVDFTRTYLLYFILPLWGLAAFVDWVCHRRSKIALKNGTREATLHLIMMFETGISILLGMFCEVNALVLAIMMSIFVLHYATAILDIAVADRQRNVSLLEQHVHGALDFIPLVILSSLVCLHAGQFLSIFGAGNEVARWNLEWKLGPIISGYALLGAGLVAIFLGALYLEEIIRCLRAERRLNDS